MKKLNVGLYLRKSSGLEDNINLLNQKEVGIEFCKEKKYDFEIYSEIISGGNLDRIEFNKMIKDCEGGKLDGVWVFKYDRLERNMESMILFRNVCVKYGIKFWVGNEEYNLNDNSDRLNIGFRSLISEDERFRIRDRVVRGKKFKLRSGKYIIGRMRYGYNVDGGIISINKEESKYVKLIYKIFLYKNVNSYSETELRLNNKFNKSGSIIGVNKIRKILKDDLYLGYLKMIFDKEEFEFNFDNIISEDDNLKVKLKIKELNSLRKRKGSEDDFLLKGKIFCNCCNSIMWIVGSNMKKYYRYYSCSVEVNKINIRNNYRNKEIKVECDSILRNKINLEKVEKIVWDCLFDVLLNSEKILNEYGEKYKDDRINEKNYLNKIKFYENKRLDRKEIFLDVVKKLGNDDSLSDVLDLEKRNYFNDIGEYDKSINELTDNINKLIVLDNKDLLEDRIKEDLKVIYEDIRFKNRKRFLDKYVDSVFVERKNDSRKEILFDIIVKFKFELVGKKFNKNNQNMNKEKLNNNNFSIIDKNIYKLKDLDFNGGILVYKSYIKIELLVNCLLVKNSEKNYDIGYIESKLYY